MPLLQRRSSVVGRVIGHYRIVRRLGHGGMGVVFAAEDQKLGRTVALKFLSEERAGSGESIARLRREARAASALNHENICTIFAVEDGGPEPFIVMELLEGRSLDSCLSQQMPVEQVLEIGIQAAEALAAAHGRNILHRDIKPANLFLTAAGRLKVVDFGLAKLAAPAAVSATASTHEYSYQTKTGSVVGTAAYMSPEQARGEAIDARSDIFSLGCVLYEVATGRHPFAAPTQAAVFHAILDSKPPSPPSQLRPLPPQLDEVLLRCLEKDRELRTQTAAELRADLKRVQRALVAGIEVPAAGKESQKFRLRRSAPAVALAAAALALLAGVFLMASHYGWRAGKNPAQTAAEDRGTGFTSITGKPSPVAEANESLQRAVKVLIDDVPRGRKLVEATLELDPRFVEARCWHAFSGLLVVTTGYSSDLQELYRAEQELRPALREDPNSAHCHAVLAGVYYYQGRFALLRKEAEIANRLDPHDEDANIWLASYFILRGKYAEAQHLSRTLLSFNPFFFPASVAWADSARQIGDLPAAVAELNKVLEADPHNVIALQLLCLVQLAQGDNAAARKTLAAVEPKDRGNYNVRLAWADVYAFEHDRARALNELSPQTVDVIRLDPGLVAMLAECYALLGEKQQALDWLEKAIRGGDERADFFARDPLLANVHHEPRFKNMLVSLRNAIADQSQTADRTP
jgi:tetratricopeptide (TPR) repeat protein/predicted Ser/Thr protein kinase